MRELNKCVLLDATKFVSLVVMQHCREGGLLTDSTGSSSWVAPEGDSSEQREKCPYLEIFTDDTAL